MDLSISEDFLKVLEYSRDEALRTGWHNVCPDHIMLAVLRDGDNPACAALEACGVSSGHLKTLIDEALFVNEQVPWEERESVHLSESAVSALQAASLEAARCHSDIIGPVHFLLGVCRVSGSFSHDALCDLGISLRGLIEASGMDWNAYGLARQSSSAGNVTPVSDRKSPGIPDPALMAAAIEQRLREGYSTDNPIAS